MHNFRIKIVLILVFFVFLSWESILGQQPDTSSVEWIKVSFNMPADHSVAKQGNEADDKADLLNTLITLIDSARYSIDLAIYDLQNLKVGEALVRAAHNRGVRVRIVTDYYNRYRDRDLGGQMWGMLREAGIYSIDDGGDVFNPDGSVTPTDRLESVTICIINLRSSIS